MTAERSLRAVPKNEKRTPETGINSQFKVVMLFEDFSTGLRAKSTMDRVIENLEAHFPFEIKFWRFDLLEHAHFRELAASEAADAEMVIVSSHGGPHIPDGLKKWVQLWLINRPVRDCAIVELLDSRGDADGPWPIHGFFQKVSRKADLDLFCHSVGQRQEEPLLESHPEPGHATFSR